MNRSVIRIEEPQEGIKPVDVKNESIKKALAREDDIIKDFREKVYFGLELKPSEEVVLHDFLRFYLHAPAFIAYLTSTESFNL